MSTGAVLSAVGLCTALGDSALAVTAAVRARLSRFREWPDYPCLAADPPRPGKPFYAVVAHTNVPRGQDVPLRLLTRAMQDLVSSADLVREDLEGASFWVAIPEREAPQRAAWGAAIASSVGLEAAGSARVVTGGHATMLALLGAASREIAANPDMAIVVAGADSLVHPDVLPRLDESGRLKSHRNLDGFIPGEGAAAVLVEGRKRAEARGAVILAEIEGCGLAAEPRTIESGDPPSGEALTKCIQDACAAGGPPPWVLCDMNGESYRAKEWALARVRARPLLDGVRKLWHPADGYGDVGTATGGALVALSAAALGRRVSPAPRALLLAGSDDGARAAVTLVSAGAGMV